MKIVTASTEEQQSYVQSRITYFYESLFPSFFSKTYVEDLSKFGILAIENLEDYSLKEILEVTAALQTLQSLLECICEHSMGHKHAEQFQHNTDILEKYGIYFPFYYEDFSDIAIEVEGLMGKAENQWIL